MILGIGNDIIDIRRIEQSLERFGDRFVQRLFTETEQKRSERRKLRAASYAKRFAAKEACSKALGTGLHLGLKGLRSRAFHLAEVHAASLPHRAAGHYPRAPASTAWALPRIFHERRATARFFHRLKAVANAVLQGAEVVGQSLQSVRGVHR